MLIDLDYEVINLAREIRNGSIPAITHADWSVVLAVAEAADNTVVHDGTFGPSIDGPYYDDEYVLTPHCAVCGLPGLGNHHPNCRIGRGDPS